MSYKRGIGDVRGSPALRIMELLRGKGAEVCYHDPFVPQVACNGDLLYSLPLTEQTLAAQDCVVLVTDHDYDLALLLSKSRLVIDTRNAVGGYPQLANCVRLWGRNGSARPRPAAQAGIHYDHSAVMAGTGGAGPAPSPPGADVVAELPAAEAGQR